MRALVFVLTMAALLWACGEGSSPLAKGEVGGAGGQQGGAGGTSASATTTTTGSGGSGGTEEPPGPTRLTIVNGIVDADGIRVCFLTTSGAPQTPWPGVEGLPYARGADATSLLPGGGDAEMFVLAGNLALTGGASCDELIATPPLGLTIRSVGLLPESVFSAKRSILLVPMGCVGGPGHSDEQLEEAVCGGGYDPDFGNASLAAGFMSRLQTSDRISLQFVQASMALPSYELRLKANATAPPQLVLASWSLGAIAPYPPYLALSEAQLATPAEAVVGIHQTATTVVHQAPWGEAFANSNLGPDDVVDGRGLVFIAVGPSPSSSAGTWWNGFTFTVVAPDP